MRQTPDTTLMLSAAQKMETGALLTMAEVCALMNVTPSVVHKLPLPSIRVGRSLRFAPSDVSELIRTCKEAAIPHVKNPQSLYTVYFGMKYHDETRGALGYLTNAWPAQRIDWSDVMDALHVGRTVTIAPASPAALAFAEEMLEQFKAREGKKPADIIRAPTKEQ